MPGRFVLVPAAYVFLLRGDHADGEVLLQLREGTGFMDGHWAAAAAGHIEQGESVFAAAAREAREELDIGDLAVEPLCAMHRRYTDAPIDQRVDYFLTARTWSGEPRIVEPDKCAELRWCRLDDLPDPVVPHERAVLEALRKGSVPPIMTFGF